MKKYYTRKEIANMNSKEFQNNEMDIMNQLSTSGIKNADYINYKNPITGCRGVFTKERLKSMSSEKFAQCEKEIMAQLGEIGLPSRSEIGFVKHFTDDKPDIIYDENRADYEIVGYEWIAFEGACDDCLNLKGTVFLTIDEIPYKLHPNCRCEIYPIYF